MEWQADHDSRRDPMSFHKRVGGLYMVEAAMEFLHIMNYPAASYGVSDVMPDPVSSTGQALIRHPV